MHASAESHDDRAPLWRWQHVLSLLALAGTAGGLYLAYALRDHARLDLVPLAESTIADLHGSGSSELKLTFNGEVIGRASVISYLVRNSGNTHLQRTQDALPADPRNPRSRIILPGTAPRVLSVRLTPQGEGARAVIEQLAGGDSRTLDYGIVAMNSGSGVQLDAIVADYEPGTLPMFEVGGVGIAQRVIPAPESRELSWWEIVLVLGVSFLAVRVLRPITQGVAAAAGRIGWLSLLGGAVYGFVVDFEAREPSEPQRVRGLRMLISSAVFLTVGAIAWRAREVLWRWL